MKKVMLVLCVFAISSLLALPVQAKQTVSDTDAQIVQSVCQDDTLNAYVNLPKEKESNSLIVSAVIDNEFTYKQTEPIAKMSNLTIPVSYLFLIDISTSMPKYEENIKAFINGFLNSAEADASFGVATFGKEFTIVKDFTKDKDEIKNTLDSIQYNVNQTSLYSSIMSAIDYYDKKERSDGEFYNIVVISDGVEVDKDGVTKEEVDQKISSSCVMIHTFGLPTQSSDADKIKTSEESIKVLGSFARSSLGVHTVLGYESENEEDLAKEIIDFIDNLSVVKFNLSNFIAKGENDYPYKLVFANTGENGDYFDAKGSVRIIGSAATLEPEETENKPNDISSATENTEETVISGSNEESSVNKGAEHTIFGINRYLFIAGVSILIIALLLFMILLAKRMKRNTKQGESGIFIKVDILSDHSFLKKNSFYLNNELLIGRNKKCDIRLKNKDISNLNSKIYIRENMIYIEDLNSTNGTAINNVKIYSPNKLRSGDIVSIGSVKLVLKF